MDNEQLLSCMENYKRLDVVFSEIDEEFANGGLTEDDSLKAKLFLLSYLSEENTPDIPARLCNCFLMQEGDSSLSDILSREFCVEITDVDSVFLNGNLLQNSP